MYILQAVIKSIFNGAVLNKMNPSKKQFAQNAFTSPAVTLKRQCNFGTHTDRNNFEDSYWLV